MDKVSEEIPRMYTTADYTTALTGIMNYQIAYLIMKKTWSNFIFQQGLSRNKAIWVGIASQLIIAVILSYDTGSVTALDFTRLLAQDWFVDMPHPYLLLWVYNDV